MSLFNLESCNFYIGKTWKMAGIWYHLSSANFVICPGVLCKHCSVRRLMGRAPIEVQDILGQTVLQLLGLLPSTNLVHLPDWHQEWLLAALDILELWQSRFSQAVGIVKTVEECIIVIVQVFVSITPMKAMETFFPKWRKDLLTWKTQILNYYIGISKIRRYVSWTF